MRIAINCRSFMNKNYAGIGRYAFNLVSSLGEIDHDNEYWLYAQKPLFNTRKNIPLKPAKNFSVKVDHFNRGLEKILGQVDLYHSPSPDFIPTPTGKAKIIVTVHDLIYKTYPEGHTTETCEATDKQLKSIVTQADKIICCSQSTVNDLKKFFNVDDQKVRLVFQGVDHTIFYPLNDEERAEAGVALKKRGIDQPFLLFVGTIEPRKNLQNLLRAFAFLKDKKMFSGKLVIVGMRGWKTEGIEQIIAELNIKDELIFPGYVSDDELRYCYNLAEVFVFPSFYEGFGFPIVEAFGCGAAVVTSNVSSCPEIAGDAALTVNPNRGEEIAQALSRLLGDQALKKSLQQKALARAKDFSFRKTAEQTLKVYQEVL